MVPNSANTGGVRLVPTARRTAILPAVVKPTARQLACFHEEERELLRRLLSEPVEYVDHASFHQVGAERSPCAGRLPPLADGGASRTEEPAPVAAGNLLPVPDQETRLFLEFNYARMRQVELLRQYEHQRMPVDQIRTLLGWAQRARTARCRIVESNLPLVLAMARRTRPAGLDLGELVSEGNFALLRSVDKFDCARGFKFSTYACRAILKSFSRVMMRNGRYRSRFPVEFEPALERSDHVDRRRQHQEGDAVERIAAILAENRAALNDIEQQVIRERFALNPAVGDDAAKTLQQVGEIIGVTKERVRQIQNRALRKLRTALEDDLWG